MGYSNLQPMSTLIFLGWYFSNPNPILTYSNLVYTNQNIKLGWCKQVATLGQPNAKLLQICLYWFSCYFLQLEERLKSLPLLDGMDILHLWTLLPYPWSLRTTRVGVDETTAVLVLVKVDGTLHGRLSLSSTNTIIYQRCIKFLRRSLFPLKIGTMKPLGVSSLRMSW